MQLKIVKYALSCNNFVQKQRLVVKYASQPKGSNKQNFYIAISVQVVT